MNRRDYSNHFRSAVLDPAEWTNAANALIEAAELLEPGIDAFWHGVRDGTSWNDGGIAVYFMLCSFALENLLKAQIVQKRRTDLRAALIRGSRLPNLLKGHDLHRLTCEAGLNALAEEEESLLHRLTRSAVWYGRYPVPVTALGLNSFRKSEHKDFEINLTMYASADRDDIKRLLREVGWQPTKKASNNAVQRTGKKV